MHVPLLLLFRFSFLSFQFRVFQVTQSWVCPVVTRPTPRPTAAAALLLITEQPLLGKNDKKIAPKSSRQKNRAKRFASKKSRQKMAAKIRLKKSRGLPRIFQDFSGPFFARHPQHHFKQETRVIKNVHLPFIACNGILCTAEKKLLKLS